MNSKVLIQTRSVTLVNNDIAAYTRVSANMFRVETDGEVHYVVEYAVNVKSTVLTDTGSKTLALKTFKDLSEELDNLNAAISRGGQ